MNKYGYITAHYMRSLLWIKVLFPLARTIVLHQSLNQIKFKKFNSVLIVGAGNDPYKYLFDETKRYIRIDIESHNPDVIADAHFLPFKRESFDCVFATEVLEHLVDQRTFTQEIIRVLVPNGQVILTIPFMFHNHGHPYDYIRLTKDGLRNVFSKFSSLDIYAQGNRLHVLSDLVTTSFSPLPVFFPLRIFNHLFYFLSARAISLNSTSTAPSGYLILAKK